MLCLAGVRHIVWSLLFFMLFCSVAVRHILASENATKTYVDPKLCENSRKPVDDIPSLQKYSFLISRKCIKLDNFDKRTALEQDDEGYRYVLELKLKNNDVLYLQDIIQQKPQVDVQIFSFVDYWKDVGYYVVKVGYWEGSRYFLLRDSDGEKRYIDDVPHRSPNGKRIVVVSAAEAYNRNSLEIVSVKKNDLEKEYLYDIDAARDYRLYKFVKWVGNDIVELTCFQRADERLCPGFHYMDTREVLEYKKGEWRLRLLPESVQCSTSITSP